MEKKKQIAVQNHDKIYILHRREPNLPVHDREFWLSWLTGEVQ